MQSEAQNKNYIWNDRIYVIKVNKHWKRLRYKALSQFYKPKAIEL